VCYWQHSHPAQTVLTQEDIQPPAASCGISTSWKIRGEKSVPGHNGKAKQKNVVIDPHPGIDWKH